MKPVEKPGEARGRAGEVPNLSTGIPRLWVSTIVHFTLKFPPFCPLKSTKICGCLSVLLSVLLSTLTEKIQYTGRFVTVEIQEKTRSE